MTLEFQARANILIDPFGRVRSGQNSAPLSSPSDRRRFHQLRSWADCIVIGGETFRSEPYHLTSIPVIHFSRSKEVISDWAVEFLEIAQRHGQKILIEAGPGLLHQLLENSIVEQLHITRTQRRSEDLSSPIFDLSLIATWQLLSSETEDQETFEVFVRP